MYTDVLTHTYIDTARREHKEAFRSKRISIYLRILFLNVESIQVTVIGCGVILEVTYYDAFNRDLCAHERRRSSAPLHGTNEGRRIATHFRRRWRIRE